MQQVAVGAVDLEPLDAEAQRPLRRSDESVAHPLQSLRIEGVGRNLVRRMGEGRGGLGAPAVGGVGGDLRAAFPGHAARRLPAGMVDLDGDGDRRVFADRVEDPGEGPLRRRVVEAEIGRRDAGLRRDGRGFQRQEAGARLGELAEMRHVPIGRRPAAGRVLAHRRDDDAVFQFEVVEAQGFEQAGGHCGTPDRLASGIWGLAPLRPPRGLPSATPLPCSRTDDGVNGGRK